MIISPSFKCNFRCPFCNVHKEDKGEILDLDYLEKIVYDIPDIKQLQILGGEPSILPTDYLDRLISICTKKLEGKKPIMYTNLYKVSEQIGRTYPIISYDPHDRQRQKTVLSNLLSLDMEYDLSLIITDNLVEHGAEELVNFVYKLKQLKRANLSVFCKQKDCDDFTPAPDKFLKFIKDIIRLDTRKKIFSPFIEFLAGRYLNSPFIEYSTEIICNGKFRCYYNSYEEFKLFDTFAEVENFYKNKKPEACCKDCEYIDYCPHNYVEDGKCIFDYQIMEEVKKYVRECAEQNILCK